jgi:hypothetical protein
MLFSETGVYYVNALVVLVCHARLINEKGGSMKQVPLFKKEVGNSNNCERK